MRAIFLAVDFVIDGRMLMIMYVHTLTTAVIESMTYCLSSGAIDAAS
jgi:hypothetical protein